MSTLAEGFRLVVPGIVLVLTLLAAAPSVAQVDLCSARGFSVTAGAVACSGSANPVRVTATVRTYARLALDEVFGSPAAGLQVALGEIDAHCVSSPAPGVSCVADDAGGSATWYGSIRFKVKLTGIGAARARVTGVRPSTGTIPGGRLLDGPSGAPPTRAYPVAPATPADLQTSIANGDTVVSRSLGLKVTSADPPAPWSGDTVFSLVLE
ncbi:MAG: hypothetical protein A3I17_07140 [Candidatus Rokubacteria bacterium RIFCSPLOWO2_02_FULL_72_37]|nr:MAG: hypothetical protein A3I17_07140 [Candidatus Rokubacteria bacterium RIFCSPLOWO2_02_FULL_72_37]